jgi:hypothetical protein
MGDGSMASKKNDNPDKWDTEYSGSGFHTDKRSRRLGTRKAVVHQAIRDAENDDADTWDERNDK